MAEQRNRRDLLAECNADGHPLDAFTTECCANCFNPECARSLAGKLKFDARTSNWYERYFGEKNTMDPKDPRYSGISAQRFIVLDPGLTGRAPEVGTSAWMDPRDLQGPPPPAAPEIPSEPPVQVVQVPESSAPQKVNSAPVNSSPNKVPHQLLLANSPPQRGQMVTAPPSAETQKPAKDPWTGPVPTPKSEIPVVSPGARVKLGGGGNGGV